MFRRFIYLSSVFLLAVLFVGCASSTACNLTLESGGDTKTRKISDMEPSVWSQLLLRGMGHTCTGTPLASQLRKSAVLLHKPKVIIQEDRAGEGRHLVWLIVDRSASSFSGPVAVVESNGRVLTARSVGTLELPVGQIDLRYSYGDTRELLWATSRKCRRVKAFPSPLCTEKLAVLRRTENRLVAVSKPLTTLREEARLLGAGWHHVAIEKSQVKESREGLTVLSELSEHEIQGQNKNAQPRQRRSQSQIKELKIFN